MTRDGELWCWGDNVAQQLGSAAAEQRHKNAVRVPDLDDIKNVAAGDRHTCAQGRSGKVWCWGDNSRGQLDGNEGPTSASPIEVEHAAGAHALSLGLGQTCAVLADRRVSCWGASKFPTDR